jgi:fatty acid desaturase
MGGDLISRNRSVLASDPEYYELIAERQRLVARQKLFAKSFWVSAVISAALLTLGLFWIGVSVGVITVTLWLAWLDLCRDPMNRHREQVMGREKRLVEKTNERRRHPSTSCKSDRC